MRLIVRQFWHCCRLPFSEVHETLSVFEAEQSPISALLMISMAGEEKELAKLVERLDKASTAYGMEISAEKIKLMTNNTSGINT